MPRLIIRLLGGFEVQLVGERVFGFETDKARALLAYLAVEAGRPHRRETLAGLLWPDRSDTVARANLRQALARLRRALDDTYPPQFLFVTHADVQFNAASDHWLDVAELERLRRMPAPGAAPLPGALSGDFLAGFALPDSEAFQAWVLDKQEYYHRLAIATLDEQIAYWESVGAYEKAVTAARLQTQMEPWLEEAHSRCMRLLALAGRRDEALRQYELCRRALAAELGVEPGLNTRSLYASIRDGAALSAERGRGTRSRGPAAPRPAPQFVDRETELAQLNGHLDAALGGAGRVIFVCGETGSGKTALLEAFAGSALAEHPDLLLAAARCSAPGGTEEPYAPLRRAAEVLFGDGAGRPSLAVFAPEHAERLQRASRRALQALAEHGWGLVGPLVPAASVARQPGSPGPAARALALGQGALFDQLVDTLADLAQQFPLLLIFDDLQWVDEGTAACLFRLGRDLAGSRVLTLAAYRPSTVATGRRDPQSGETVRHPLEPVINELRRLTGSPAVDLDNADGRGLVEALVDTEPNRLGASFRDALYAHTGGHALFTVEFLRNLQERGELRKDEAGRWIVSDRLDWGALPARVEAAIAERIGRLPESSRRLLSAASVEGEDFTAEVAAELTGAELRDVIACLSGTLARQHHLVRPQSLLPGRGAPLAAYRFTHHLIQVYLYEQLDAVERRLLHGQVAAALVRRAGADTAEQERLAARLAWHYEAAGLALPAAQALCAAGRQAVRFSAFKEARELFEHGLALLAREPRSPEVAAVESVLEIALLTPQRSLEGWSAASFEAALGRLARQGSGSEQQLSDLLMAAATSEHLIAKGELDAALAAEERLRRMAAALREEAFVALSHQHSGIVYAIMGQNQKSEEHLDQVMAWQTPARRVELRSLTGLDIATSCMVFSAFNRWQSGQIDVALARVREAVAEAELQGDLFGEAWVLAMGTVLLWLVGEEEEAAAVNSERLAQLATRGGYSLWGLCAEVLAGRLQVSRCDCEAGVPRMRGAVAKWQSVGMLGGTGMLNLVYADGCLHAARELAAPAPLLVEGLAAVDQGLDFARRTGARLFEPELYRLAGELLWLQHSQDAAVAAEAAFERGIAAAAEQGALMLELRNLVSLVRLRMAVSALGDAALDSARGRLMAVYSRFTAGWARPDLREAAELMATPAEAGPGPAARGEAGSAEHAPLLPRAGLRLGASGLPCATRR